MDVIFMQKYSTVILRLGLAAVFLWFGMTQLLDQSAWIGYVPEWSSFLGSAETIVKFNGAFEVLGGALLAVGLWTRWAALLLGTHLLVIVFEIGLTAIGVRDLGLVAATFALALAPADFLSLDNVE